MSRYFMVVAVAAMTMACQKEVPVENAENQEVEVFLGSEVSLPETKATLTSDDEKSFKSSWTTGDVMSVSFENDADENNTGVRDANWNVDHLAFATTLPVHTGMWFYNACYPKPVNLAVDLSGTRTQYGDSYNSSYDVMLGELQIENAAAGKDNSDKSIVIPMVRQTAIAYFHLKSDLNEPIVSATLTTGEGEFIATKYAYLDESQFAPSAEKDDPNGLNSITTTIEGNMSSSEFKLWFNVLPTIYTEMTLVVRTANHTLTLHDNVPDGGDMYEAGKLYKVSIPNAIPASAWTGEGGSDTSAGYVKVTEAPADWTGDYLIVYEGENETLAFDGSLTTLDAVSNTKPVTIVGDVIEATDEMKAIQFTVDYKTGSSIVYSLKSASGYYISGTTTKANASNGVKSALTDGDYEISFGIAEGNAVVYSKSSDQNMILRYNDASNQTRFRFYKSGQKPISLYKLQSSGSVVTKYNVECATVEGGTISASPAKAAEGDVVTLTATPDDGYDFESWNVIGATVADASSATTTFTMPGTDVNVSATFKEKLIPTFASLSELVAADLASGTEVTVSLENVPIKEIYVTNGGNRNGIYFDIQKGGKDIELYFQNVPAAWVAGGTVSGTLTKCPWKLYNGTWELAPASGWSWRELNYTAPVILAAPTITTQPTDATYVLNESSKNLTVVASGNPSPTYQWYSNTINSNENGTVLTGETNTSYKPSTNAIGTFYYYCVATNSEGSAASNVATITVEEPATASLPFSFDGGKSDIDKTDGMSQTGLGNDYGSSPKLKFDSAGDNVIINFNGSAKRVTYTIKGNNTSGTYAFDVMESADGIEYTTVHSHTSVTDEKSFTDNLTSSARFVKFVYTTKDSGNVALGKINISNEEGQEEEESKEKDFNTTYGYGLSDWDLTNYTDQSSYYQVPSGNDPSVATIADIFKDKTITSEVVITINCATYGSGSDPSENTFSIYKETACTNAINASQGGKLPTSSSYTNVIYTVSLADAASFTNDLAIKITKPGKTIRLKSIKVEFKYIEQ